MPFQIVKMPMWQPYAWDLNNKADCAAKLAVFRDALRSELDSSHWMVTDVPVWDGYSSYYEGVSFIVRALNGGITESIGSGDGSTVTFSGTLSDIGVKSGTVSVTDGTETFSDDGSGNLTGDNGGSGTVDYGTGDVSVTFGVAPTGGASVDSTYVGATGPEWMFATSLYSYSSSSTAGSNFDYGWGNRSSGTIGNHFRSNDGGTDFNDQSPIAFAYSPSGFPGWEFDHDGKLAGGDGSAPAPNAALNPFDNMGSFFNTDDPRGVLMNIGTHEEGSRSTYFAMIFNSDFPFVTMVTSCWEALIAGNVAIGGDIVTPYDPADTNGHAFAWWSQKNDDAKKAQTFLNLSSRVEVIDSNTSSRALVYDQFNRQFNWSNSPRQDGNYPWGPVSLTGDIHKGYFKTEVIRSIGGEDQEFHTLFAGLNHHFIKLHKHLSFAYPTNTMPWPFGFTDRH